MKFQRALLIFSGLIATAFGSCSEVDSKESPADYDIAPSTNCYFTIGTSGYYQNIGLGYRTRDLSTYRGNDFSINAKYFPIDYIDSHEISFSKHKYRIYPSVQYMRIFYNKPKEFSSSRSYFAMGVDIIGIKNRKNFYPIPNPKIAWGKENQSGQFSQFAINIVPAFVDTWWILNERKMATVKNELFLTALALSFELSFGF
ncbi:MAG: hypothetical protein S4CHLAM37_04580 [Chlamydiia bacterium]|nr:hypothetical protein [Chlamydiia bacterium]